MAAAGLARPHQNSTGSGLLQAVMFGLRTAWLVMKPGRMQMWRMERFKSDVESATGYFETPDPEWKPNQPLPGKKKKLK